MFGTFYLRMKYLFYSSQMKLCYKRRSYCIISGISGRKVLKGNWRGFDSQNDMFCLIFNNSKNWKMEAGEGRDFSSLDLKSFPKEGMVKTRFPGWCYREEVATFGRILSHCWCPQRGRWDAVPFPSPLFCLLVMRWAVLLYLMLSHCHLVHPLEY